MSKKPYEMTASMAEYVERELPKPAHWFLLFGPSLRCSFLDIIAGTPYGALYRAPVPGGSCPVRSAQSWNVGQARSGEIQMTNTENLLIALSEFIADRKEGIQSGVYQIEISNVDDGVLMELSSFGISVTGAGRFKINLDLVHKQGPV